MYYNVDDDVTVDVDNDDDDADDDDDGDDGDVADDDAGGDDDDGDDDDGDDDDGGDDDGDGGDDGGDDDGDDDVRACAVEMHMGISQEPLCKITGKMAEDTFGDIALCEPAQSKCTWTFRKSHFVWNFTGKMPNVTDTTSIKHRACNCYRKNLSVLLSYTVWGTNSKPQ